MGERFFIVGTGSINIRDPRGASDCPEIIVRQMTGASEILG